MTTKKHHGLQQRASQADDTSISAGTAQVASKPEISLAGAYQASPVGVIGLAVIGVGLMIGIIWFVRKFILPIFGKGNFKKADYKIPHCTFKTTDDGFSISYSRVPVWLTRIDPAAHPLPLNLFLVPFFFVGITLFLVKYIFLPTKILISKDAITINGTKLHRKDFGGFFIDHTKQPSRLSKNREQSDAIIGYTYGRERVLLTGLWKEKEATDFLSALNQDLRDVPIVGDEHRPSPDQLRDAARPIQF